jgi:hypothetical protein
MRPRLTPATYSSTSRIPRVNPEASPNLTGPRAPGRDLGRVRDVRIDPQDAAAARRTLSSPLGRDADDRQLTGSSTMTGMSRSVLR